VVAIIIEANMAVMAVTNGLHGDDQWPDHDDGLQDVRHQCGQGGEVEVMLQYIGLLGGEWC
jgi:hypothetical protein